MATLAGLVEDTRRLLYGPSADDRPQFDTLGATYTSGNSSVNVGTTATQWKRGDILEFSTDGLQLICTDDGSGSTVDTAVYDGTDATHSTSGELLWRNPEYGRLAIEDAINQVADNWLWPHVWTWHQDSLTFTSGDSTYVLDQYVEDVVRMYQYNLNSQNRFHPIRPESWNVELQVSTAVATNSNLLRIREQAVHDVTATVYYTGKRRPHSDDLANLSDEVAYLIPIGAAALIAEGAMLREGVDPTRGGREEGGFARDGRVHTARFFIARDNLRTQLRREVPAYRKFQGKVRSDVRVY